jgi:protein TonB
VIQEPRKTKHVPPVYPQIAQTARVQGMVIIEAVVDKEGRVGYARILKSVPLLDQAAMDAIRQWEFTPTLVDGIPVEIRMTMTANFTLTGGRRGGG